MSGWTRYPIYVPSRGRVDGQTFASLERDGVPFRAVVEADQAEEYTARYGEERVLVLPGSGEGSSVYARNWIKEHSRAEGAERHWQLDDNIRGFYRWRHRRRIRCDAGVALAVCEDMTDRYANVAISGLAYTMFMHSNSAQGKNPFTTNVHVYSCTLALNSTEFEWRGRRNEDTDMCLQVLAAGWCTLLINAFMANKMRTMTGKGGNTDLLYLADGRTEMARELERRWPGVVTVTRRFGRAQHYVDWRKFTTKLERRPDYDAIVAAQSGRFDSVKLKQVGDEVRSTGLQAVLEAEGAAGKTASQADSE